MFSKTPRESTPMQTPNIPELKLPENLVLDVGSKDNKSLAVKSANKKRVRPNRQELLEVEDSELIENIEKISRIASPYFIAIVGLSLYKDNFFFGSTLIAVGILSLLKVSARDVASLLEWIKDFFGLIDEED